jgi:diadenosine tetraphosphate (Ap4A) HIT family hydrolase
MNQTMEKFGAPESCIKEYSHWMVLFRPQQVTLGSLVLVCNEPVTTFAAVSSKAFEELHGVVGAIESALNHLFEYEKINYLMLMMVDPDVHFHVIPRYSNQRKFDGQQFHDYGWPGPPDLSRVNQTATSTNQAIRDSLKTAWQK